MLFRSILFPVDFSPASTAMVPYVREMARVCGAEVAVLHSFDLLPGYNFAGHLDPTGESPCTPIPYTQTAKKLRDQREESLKTFAREYFPGTNCRLIMEDGDPAEIIHRIVERDDIDLVMVPTSGRGTFRRLLLGSVSAKVLHDVSCAVFTTVHALDPARAQRISFQFLICAVELNEEAEVVLKTADRLASLSGARLSIVHMAQTQLHRTHTNDESELRVLTQRVGTSGAVRLLHENVAEGIRRIAAAEGADLVITGRGHERGGISRLWSNLYRIVRESPCPVLSV